MTIKECIDLVDSIKPNQYVIKEKVMWLSFVDELIINDVLKTHEGYDGRYDLFDGYSVDKLSTKLIVESPYDRLYPQYLKMKIDLENGEIQRYNNSAALFNTYLLDYKKYYNKDHMPINGTMRIPDTPCKHISAGISDAEYEKLKRELYHMLFVNVEEVISHDKLYAVAMEYYQNNTEVIKGKDGKDGEKGEKGEQGDKGEKGEAGKDFKILGYYSSLDALNSAVVSPSVGDAYGVGEAAPYDIYIYDDKSGWVNNGPIAAGIDIDIRNGTGENSLEGADSEDNPAIALGEGCVSLGDGCVSGCMGYYIQAIDFDSKKIYLTDTKVTGLPTVGAGVVVADFATPAYEVNAKFSIINGNHYPLCGTIISVENNVVTYNGDLGFTAFENDTGIDGHVFYVPTQPTVGVVSFVTGAVTLGDGNINVGKCAFVAGRDNIALEGYGTNIGRRNTTGYGSVTLGLDNYVPAQFGVALGNKNTVTGYAGVALGERNEVTGYDASAIGYRLKAYSDSQNVRGKYNIADEAGEYADIVGNGTGAKPSNAYALDWGGNARFAGKVYAECENGIGKGKELATKEDVANKNLGNVDNDYFKQKGIASGLVTDSALVPYDERISVLEEDIFEVAHPILMRSSLKGNLYTALRPSYTTTIKEDTDIGLRYTDITLKNTDYLLMMDCYNLPTIPLSSGEIYVKILMRTNQVVKPYIELYSITDINGDSIEPFIAAESETYTIGNNEWEEVIVKLTDFSENAYASRQVHILFAGRSKRGVNYFDTEGNLINDAQFDIAAWAVFDNLDVAEQYDMIDAAMGYSGFTLDDSLSVKANKSLSNVENEVFLQKAIDSGLVNYIISQIPTL